MVKSVFIGERRFRGTHVSCDRVRIKDKLSSDRWNCDVSDEQKGIVKNLPETRNLDIIGADLTISRGSDNISFHASGEHKKRFLCRVDKNGMSLDCIKLNKS